MSASRAAWFAASRAVMAGAREKRSRAEVYAISPASGTWYLLLFSPGGVGRPQKVRWIDPSKSPRYWPGFGMGSPGSPVVEK